MPSRPKQIILLPIQEIFVLVIILFAASIDTQDYVQEPDTARVPKLVDQIRRQLMKDNYDYEDALHVNRAKDSSHADSAERVASTEGDDGPQLTTTTHDDDDDFIMPTMRDTSEHKDKNKEKPGLGPIMSRKDLLYYIDDKRMRRAGRESDADADDDTAEGSDVDDATKPDAKYKMITVKEGEPTRRKWPSRRFIQESNREGYSIIRLDDRPFPAFRLPRARRQYMGADSADGPLPAH